MRREANACAQPLPLGRTRDAEPVPAQQRAGCFYSPGCQEKVFSETGLPPLVVSRELRGHKRSRVNNSPGPCNLNLSGCLQLAL
jgi:hypothetical protein